MTSDEMLMSESLETVSLSFEGVVEGISDGFLSGWVWDRNDSNAEVVIEIVGSFNFYFRAVANQFREDLQRAGKKGGKCAFSVPIPHHLAEISIEKISVLLDGTSHRVPDISLQSSTIIENWLDYEPEELQRQIFIVRNCFYILDRLPSSEEFERWAPLFSIKAHKNSALIESLLKKRIEEQSNGPMFSVESIVRSVYVGVLGREPEERGIEIYGHALRSGLALSSFINELINTAEFSVKVNKAASHAGEALELRRLASVIERSILTLVLCSGNGFTNSSQLGDKEVKIDMVPPDIQVQDRGLEGKSKNGTRRRRKPGFSEAEGPIS